MVAQAIEPLTHNLLTGEFLVGIAFFLDQLTAHLARCQAGVEPLVSKLRVGLALPLYQSLDVFE